MKIKDIVIGNSYRHMGSPNYCWAKVLKILKPGEENNTTKKILVKCEWTRDKDSGFGFIKYFSPVDLIYDKYN